MPHCSKQLLPVQLQYARPSRCVYHRAIIIIFNVDLLMLGTFWYHSHLSTQYCDGLRGAMVIYDPNDPHAALYDIDNGTLHLIYWH